MLMTRAETDITETYGSITNAKVAVVKPLRTTGLVCVQRRAVDNNFGSRHGSRVLGGKIEPTFRNVVGLTQPQCPALTIERRGKITAGA